MEYDRDAFHVVPRLTSVKSKSRVKTRLRLLYARGDSVSSNRDGKQGFEESFMKFQHALYCSYNSILMIKPYAVRLMEPA